MGAPACIYGSDTRNSPLAGAAVEVASSGPVEARRRLPSRIVSLSAGTALDVAARLNAVLIGRYSIEREIGAGGMATVYLARDLKHNRRVGG